MTALADPVAEIPRDRYGRPMVVPLNGGKPVAYTRCTTFVSCLEDTYNLSRWQQRMVAIGLSHRPDLALAVAAHREDKGKLNEICEAAIEAAAASASATTGTALHALTEQHDRGQDLGVIPDTARADIDAYIAATTDMKHLAIEQFVVHDGFKIGGTFDRLVDYQGKTYIADLKTGSVDYGMGKIAMQLAVYARSLHYDPRSHERTPIEGVDRDRAIVIHLPAGTATCRLLWVNIEDGWKAVQVAQAVRNWRARKDLAQEISAVAIDSDVDPLLDLINVADSEDALASLWRTHSPTGHWTETHTTAAAERKRQLSEGEAA